LKTADLQRKWALAGAQARLRELHAELADIYRVFPDLKRSGTTAAAAAPEGGGRKRQFSSKGKAAISEGMRKYWARRKAQAAKAAKG
jgi:hypothetical protein